MAKVTLAGKFFNNIYLGGPEGPKEDELRPFMKLMQPADYTVDPFTLTVYQAQWNFADSEPSPKVPLPGQPTEEDAGGVYGDYATYNKSTQDTTQPLGNYLSIFVGDGKMWSAISYSGGYLASFKRGAGSIRNYNAVGGYFDDNGDEVTDPLTPGHYYTWKGWGVMYYLGTTRPAGGFWDYPQLGLAEQYIGPNNNTFTFDYAKTAIRFLYTTNKAIEVLHGAFV